MKRITFLFLMFLCVHTYVVASTFVRISGNQFLRNGKPYYFIGTNYWYGPILGSEGEGGDRVRLCRELDSLKVQGLDNLRILVGPDAGSVHANSVWPVLQQDDGTLNDTLLGGLDFLLAEMGKREMLAVIYLTNSWDWSGGYGSYLRRSGLGDSPNASGEGYNEYVKYASQFSLNKGAQEMYWTFVEKIISRTNRFTQVKYVDDPTIMSWQLCNEPRPFSKEAKEPFAVWLCESAARIKKMDKNHLVSTGSEGLYGCESDEELCERIHRDDNIDYLTVHIWPYNWKWVDKTRLVDDLPHSFMKTQWYIDLHTRMARGIGKPFVIEEFGYPRDRFSFSPGSSSTCRDSYFTYVMNAVLKSAERGGYLAGCNFWGWGGEAEPVHERWEKGDPYVCDPPHEPQGWYSVFQKDTSTREVIRSFVHQIDSICN